ncbi:unnamed protein product [Clavelina lepadiformis]|uniref:Nucleoporin NUP188 n=1 Tax=Clavelina lepadiformis TaxID=159417 RepID=A0ABP0F2P5_CLALP
MADDLVRPPVQTICYQELWSVAMGFSFVQSTKAMEKELLSSVKYLRPGLDYFKPYNESSMNQLKENAGNIPENQLQFVLKAAKLLNIDCRQMKVLVDQFATSYFRGSKEKFNQMLSEEKAVKILLSDVSNHYFVERLYLLRTLGCIVGYFQDEDHPYQKVYTDVLANLPDMMPTLLDQLEKSFKVDLRSSTTRGPYYTNEMVTRFCLQKVKEECEILELIILYHSQYPMSTATLVKLLKLFKEHGFGLNYCLSDVHDNDRLTQHLSCMSALEQTIIIEGFDVELLQESDAIEEHALAKNKEAFNQIDTTIKSLSDQQELSPLLLCWATIRYLLMTDQGGVETHKLGDRAVANKVWRHVIQLLHIYPFNSDSKVASVSKRVIREVLSCVTRTFHEDSLGDYSDLIYLATMLLGNTPKHGHEGISNCGLEALLSSAVGYFPLNIEPMLMLLSSMTKTQSDSLQIHAYISNLPVFAEFITTCARDEVESLEDGAVWRLINSKPIRTAGGMHTVRIPHGTVGQLVDSHCGAMVQWQHQVDGWKFFLAEIQSVLEYKGPSSDLELLGYFKKTQLILHLVENLLISMQTKSSCDTGCMAMLETMHQFVDKLHQILQKIVQTPIPPIKLVETCLRCAMAWIDVNPKSHANKTVSQFSQIRYFPSKDEIGFNLSSTSSKYHPGVYGALLTECEKVNGSFDITVATIDFMIILLEYSLNHDEKMSSYLSISVEFILTEVFGSYQMWHSNDSTSWGNIGVRCLELCHLILCSSTNMDVVPDTNLKLQKTVVNLLSHGNIADVLLNLACVSVDTLHSLLANKPFSPPVLSIIDALRLSFSILNNLLRIESAIVPSDELESSYLHNTLTTPGVGDNNLISVIAGYLYHRQNVALPRLAVSLLRRISLIAPMHRHLK